MKKKLVKRPLRAYVSTKKGDVYGYERPDRWGGGGGGGWGEWILTKGLPIAGLAVGTAALFTPAAPIVGALAISLGAHSLLFLNW
ncbi:MAG: hypothetical protein KAT86_04405 [Candidatus Latescibacteria bacterium]|nr:hypothetical protein [Candidatus Latescibacterota bacterium]